MTLDRKHLEAFVRRFRFTADAAFAPKTDHRALNILMEIAQREFPRTEFDELRSALQQTRQRMKKRRGQKYTVWETDVW